MTAARTTARPTHENPNTVAELIRKRAELAAFRKNLEADIAAVTCDLDHLEAAIRIFDPDDSPTARRRYAAMHRAPKGQSTRFVLEALPPGPIHRPAAPINQGQSEADAEQIDPETGEILPA